MSDLMIDIDERFRLRTGLADRRYYKIYYSHIHPFPLMVLGQNPGGESDGTDLVASESFFENWEHDYVCFRDHPRYRMARPMCNLLAASLETDAIDVLRQVPASNVIFRRSANTKRLEVSPRSAATESAPFLTELLKVVNPQGDPAGLKERLRPLCPASLFGRARGAGRQHLHTKRVRQSLYLPYGFGVRPFSREVHRASDGGPSVEVRRAR